MSTNPITNPPRFIALCGHPKAGKSTVQEILEETYGVVPIDDGHPMREFAVNNLGLSWDCVRTQVGKARSTEILGRRWQNRELLGELGNHFEELFGDHIMPFMAMARARKMEGKSFSFGSVCRDQGLAYKAQGGIVIEIRNPLAGPSDFEFDRFDEAVADYRIENDALARGFNKPTARCDLAHKVFMVLAEHDHKTRKGLLDRAAGRVAA